MYNQGCTLSRGYATLGNAQADLLVLSLSEIPVRVKPVSPIYLMRRLSSGSLFLGSGHSAG
jgi:hypothetical protein